MNICCLGKNINNLYFEIISVVLSVTIRIAEVIILNFKEKPKKLPKEGQRNVIIHFAMS